MGEFNSKNPERTSAPASGSEWDILTKSYYPQLDGETDSEYDDRLKFMRDKTEEYRRDYEATTDKSGHRTERYVGSNFGKKELESEAKFDRVAEKLDALVKNGTMSKERADALLERQLNESVKEIDGIRQDYKDSMVVGDPEEEKSYQDWLESHDAENQENLSRTGRVVEIPVTEPKPAEPKPVESKPAEPIVTDTKTAETTADSTDKVDPETAASFDLLVSKVKSDVEAGELSAAYVKKLGELFLGIASGAAVTTHNASPKKSEEEGEDDKNSDDDNKDKKPETISDEERARLEAEAREKAELEAKAKLEAEKAAEAAKTPEQRREYLKTRLAEINQKISEIESSLTPLTAVNADFTYDKRELAHNLAERDLTTETAKSNLIVRLWKGKLFKNYFEQKYEREYLAGVRKVETEDGKMSLSSLIREKSADTIYRFVLGATEDMGYAHKKGGDKLEPEDEKVESAAKSAIEEFALAKIDENTTLEDLKRDFSKKMKGILASSDKRSNRLRVNNYLDVAIQARQRAEHGVSMGVILGGFKAYHAEVRSKSPNEAYLGSIDSLFSAVESGKIDITESSTPETSDKGIDPEVRRQLDELEAKIKAATERAAAATAAKEALNKAPSAEEPSEAERGQKAFRDLISENMGDLIGEEGLDIMTMPEGASPEDDARFASWWDSISDEAKEKVADYFTNGAGASVGWGRPLRNWLKLNEKIS